MEQVTYTGDKSAEQLLREMQQQPLQFFIPSEPAKYWWLKYNGDKTYEAVVDIHPFQFMRDLNRKPQAIVSSSPTIPVPAWIYYVLDKWQSISVEEYNLWKELNDN